MGRDIDQFWRLTLRQINTVFEGEQEKAFRAQEIAYYNAYHAGIFSQNYESGKFPKYQTNAPKRAGEKSSKKSQTWQQQKAMAIALNAAFGGLTKTTDKA